jgi:hypothetical protein
MQEASGCTNYAALAGNSSGHFHARGRSLSPCLHGADSF